MGKPSYKVPIRFSSTLTERVELGPSGALIQFTFFLRGSRRACIPLSLLMRYRQTDRYVTFHYLGEDVSVNLFMATITGTSYVSFLRPRAVATALALLQCIHNGHS